MGMASRLAQMPTGPSAARRSDVVSTATSSGEGSPRRQTGRGRAAGLLGGEEG
jgi:hypothetical protein